MALEIIATAGASDANSYVTLAEAEAIAFGYLNRATWIAASDADKNASFVMATRNIDSLSLAGTPIGQQGDESSTSYQPLHFPTTDTKTYIPDDVKTATTVQAMYLIRSGEESQAVRDIIDSGVEEQDTGRFKSVYNKGWATTVTQEAQQALSKWKQRTVNLEFG